MRRTFIFPPAVAVVLSSNAYPSIHPFNKRYTHFFDGTGRRGRPVPPHSPTFSTKAPVAWTPAEDASRQTSPDPHHPTPPTLLDSHLKEVAAQARATAHRARHREPGSASNVTCEVRIESAAFVQGSSTHAQQQARACALHACKRQTYGRRSTHIKRPTCATGGARHTSRGRHALREALHTHQEAGMRYRRRSTHIKRQTCATGGARHTSRGRHAQREALHTHQEADMRYGRRSTHIKTTPTGLQEVHEASMRAGIACRWQEVHAGSGKCTKRALKQQCTCFLTQPLDSLT
eukprot:354903-Chlamydomonas_euryale.AAC.40